MVDKLKTDSNEKKKRRKPKRYKNFSLFSRYNNKAYKGIQKITIV